jgi:hypothetical protein
MSDQIATPLPYVDATAVAEYLKLDRCLVLALTRRWIIPAHPVDPSARKKIWRYKLSEVDTAISQGTGKPSTGIKEVAQTSTPRNNLAGSPRSRKEIKRTGNIDPRKGMSCSSLAFTIWDVTLWLHS